MGMFYAYLRSQNFEQILYDLTHNCINTYYRFILSSKLIETGGWADLIDM